MTAHKHEGCAMFGLFSISTGAFVLLLSLLAPVKPLPMPDPDAEADKNALELAKAKRRRAIGALLRLLGVLYGALALLINFIGGIGAVVDWRAFGFLLALYGGLILLVQRSEVNRRVATLLILAFAAYLIERYAHYRAWVGESNWGIYAALLANYLFWLFIGRRWPVASSAEIKVWGMDMQ
jgi:hypothetical protein